MLHSAFWLEHRLWGDCARGLSRRRDLCIGGGGASSSSSSGSSSARGAVRRFDLRASSGVRRIGGLDIGAEEHAVRGVLSDVGVCVFVREPTATHDRPTSTDLRSAHYWVAFAFFVCALLSKTVTATLPAALLVVLWWQRGRLDWRRDVRAAGSLVWTAATAGAFTIWFEHEVIGARGADFTLSAVQRVLLAGRVVWFYLAKLLWPAGLNFIYPRWSIDASAAWQYLFSIAAVALAVALGVLARRASRLRAVFAYRCGGQAWASRGISVLRRHAGPRAGLRERLSVSLFLCRRSLPVSGEPRRHRAGRKHPGSVIRATGRGAAARPWRRRFL